MNVESRIVAALEYTDGPLYEGLLLVIADCSRSYFYRVLDRLAAQGVICRNPDNPEAWMLR